MNDKIVLLNKYAIEGYIDKFSEILETIRDNPTYSQVYHEGLKRLASYRTAILENRRTVDGETIYSMRNEQLYLSKLVTKLDPKLKYVIDIGAGDGINWSNVFHFLCKGWDGLLIEGRPDGIAQAIRNCGHLPGNIIYVAAFIAPEKIVDLLSSIEVPKRPTIISVDIDSLEYRLVDTMLAHYRPSIMCIEINERLPPPIEYMCNIQPTKVRRDLTLFSSASIQSWYKLLLRYDYKLYRLEYNNLIAVDGELAEFNDIPVRTPESVYHDFIAQPDKHVLFPWNNQFYKELIDPLGSHDFTAVPTVELEEFFHKKLAKII